MLTFYNSGQPIVQQTNSRRKYYGLKKRTSNRFSFVLSLIHAKHILREGNGFFALSCLCLKVGIIKSELSSKFFKLQSDVRRP